MRKVIVKTDAGIQCWCPNCMGKFDKKTNWYAEVCKHCGQHLDWTEVKKLDGSGDGVIEDD
jgi:uncharacterized protein (DUF983 family)